MCMFVYSQICFKFIAMIKLKTFHFSTFLFVSDQNYVFTGVSVLDNK